LKETFLLLGDWLYAFLTHRLTLLAVGGTLGVYARYFMSLWIGSPGWTRGFPLSTFVINVSGSFLLGAAAILIRERLPPAYGYLYLLVGTGFCGGYTTFSTFEYETFQLTSLGSWGQALANVLGSVAAGFLGVLLAVVLVRGLVPRG